MQRCWRCSTRLVYFDGEDQTCLACGRTQSVRPVLATKPVIDTPAEGRMCAWCVERFTPNDRAGQPNIFCSYDCRMHAKNAAKRRTPRPIRGERLCPVCGQSFMVKYQRKQCCTKRCANRHAYRKRQALTVA